MRDGAAGTEGRRSKASKGGNRGYGNIGSAAGAMGIWGRRARQPMAGSVMQRVDGRCSERCASGGLQRALRVVVRFEVTAGYLDALCRGCWRSGDHSERVFRVETRS